MAKQAHLWICVPGLPVVIVEFPEPLVGVMRIPDLVKFEKDFA